MANILLLSYGRKQHRERREGKSSSLNRIFGLRKLICTKKLILTFTAAPLESLIQSWYILTSIQDREMLIQALIKLQRRGMQKFLSIHKFYIFRNQDFRIFECAMFSIFSVLFPSLCCCSAYHMMNTKFHSFSVLGLYRYS